MRRCGEGKIKRNLLSYFRRFSFTFILTLIFLFISSSLVAFFFVFPLIFCFASLNILTYFRLLSLNHFFCLIALPLSIFRTYFILSLLLSGYFFFFYNFTLKRILYSSIFFSPLSCPFITHHLFLNFSFNKNRYPSRIQLKTMSY